MRFWGCWKSKPRGQHISPCAHGKDDPRCKGCADNPKTLEDRRREQEQDEIQLRVQRSWAKRWNIPSSKG